MINHHPDDNLLTEYASGSLAWALGISVCAHLQLCPHCRQRVENLNKLGGTILSHSVAEQVAPETFEQLMARIRAQKPNPTIAVPDESALQPTFSSRHDAMFSGIPKVIEKLLPEQGLRWQKSSGALKLARITTGQDQYEVGFQKITSGGKVIEHDHRGLEVTLVLYGSFSDEDGVYTKGDFLVRSPGEIHRPTATLNQDCLCFSVTEAPVKVTGWLGKIINPFLSFKPA